MKAFVGTVQTKSEAVKEAKRHRKLDMLIKGTYGKGEGESFKGCSVGCTYTPFKAEYPNLSLHKISEPVHGIPESLTRLRDRIFENLDNDDAKDWHVKFTMSISVGADLSKVTDKLMLFLMTDKNGILKHANPKTKDIINKIASMYKLRIKGQNPTKEQWVEVKNAAAAAAAAADAAYADAAYAAAAAAYAAAAYAADAAYAAAAAAAAYAADAAVRKKYFKKIVTKLLKLMKDA